MIIKGKEIVIDGVNFKLRIPCSSEPTSLIGKGRVVVRDLKALYALLNRSGLFEKLRLSTELGVLRIVIDDRREILLFDSGKLKVNGFELAEEAEKLIKLLLALVFFSNSEESDPYFELIVSRYSSKLKQVRCAMLA